MTSDERKTLEALTTDPVLPDDARGMVAAALREVDALTQQLATLQSAQWACHVCGKRIAPGGGSIVIAHDDECRCADRIADLEARAKDAAEAERDAAFLDGARHGRLEGLFMAWCELRPRSGGMGHTMPGAREMQASFGAAQDLIAALAADGGGDA